MKKGPIIIIEDDLDDQAMLRDAFRENVVHNELVFFDNGPEAFQYLLKTEEQPFFILCDVNLPKQNGIEFKRDIDGNEYLRKKSVPFIFYTTYVSKYAVNEAYSNLTVQGFFQKSDTYPEFREVIKLIVQYWKLCKHPNT